MWNLRDKWYITKKNYFIFTIFYFNNKIMIMYSNTYYVEDNDFIVDMGNKRAKWNTMLLHSQAKYKYPKYVLYYLRYLVPLADSKYLNIR